MSASWRMLALRSATFALAPELALMSSRLRPVRSCCHLSPNWLAIEGRSLSLRQVAFGAGLELEASLLAASKCSLAAA